MAFGNTAHSGHRMPSAEINMVPLIDVMLVLLVIFIITAPLLTHSVKVDLPRLTSAAHQAPPKSIQLGVRASGEYFWNTESVSALDLEARMHAAAAADPQTELHIRADTHAEYGVVAKALGMASRSGLTKVGFVSDPERTPH